MRFDLGTLDSGERSLPFGLLVFYLPTHHIFGVKYINFTCMFGEKLLLFNRPTRFYLFNFISILSPRLIKFQNFPVNQLIKNAGLRIIFFNCLDVLNFIICMFSGTAGDI